MTPSVRAGSQVALGCHPGGHRLAGLGGARSALSVDHQRVRPGPVFAAASATFRLITLDRRAIWQATFFAQGTDETDWRPTSGWLIRELYGNPRVAPTIITNRRDLLAG
jgi:hypothetical protein